MILSDKHKYVFIQNQRTASTSTGNELCRHYNGRPIIRKHARYKDFLKIATPGQKHYTVIVGKRNPLDDLVTLYFRSKYVKKIPQKPGLLRDMRLITREEDLSFTDFFIRFLSNRPVKAHLQLDIENADFVIRYEHLQQDFSTMLKMLKMTQIQPIPWRRPTPNKRRNFHVYYPPKLRPTVIKQYSKIMNDLGYEFPTEWNKQSRGNFLRNVLSKIIKA